METMSQQIRSNVKVLESVLDTLKSLVEVRVDGSFSDGERYWDHNKCPSCKHWANPREEISHAGTCELIKSINELEAYIEAEIELENLYASMENICT